MNSAKIKLLLGLNVYNQIMGVKHVVFIKCVRWVIGSIPHGEPTELCLVPARAPRMV